VQEEVVVEREGSAQLVPSVRAGVRAWERLYAWPATAAVFFDRGAERGSSQEWPGALA